MDSYDFYRITKQQLETQAQSKGIKNLSRYYVLTDYHEGSFLNNYSGKSQIFAQIAFHAQNATMISSIVKFERNVEFLSSAFCSFDPELFCNEYPADKREESVQRIVDRLRFDPETSLGLIWDSSKSKNKDSIVRRYANTLIDAAKFVNQFASREEFLKTLLSYYKNNNYKALINYFRKNIQHGFSVALTCDFLKEFDQSFSALPKPDIHIKDTLCALYGYEKNYYNTEQRELNCIETMQTLVEQINDKLPHNEKITVYQLDRMIWLICSGYFFLDDAGGYKERYINTLRKNMKPE